MYYTVWDVSEVRMTHPCKYVYVLPFFSSNWLPPLLSFISSRLSLLLPFYLSTFSSFQPRSREFAISPWPMKYANNEKYVYVRVNTHNHIHTNAHVNSPCPQAASVRLPHSCRTAQALPWSGALGPMQSWWLCPSCLSPAGDLEVGLARCAGLWHGPAGDWQKRDR